MNWDGVLNVIFFAIGLAIGLYQLHVGQRQFETQQQDKMDELRNYLAAIQQRLAVLEELMSQRAFEVQDKLIRLATGEEAIAEFTEDTVKQVRDLVANELKKAGVHDSVARTKSLEEKLSHVVEKSASSLVEYATSEAVAAPTIRGDQILELVSQGLNDQEIAQKLMVSVNIVKGYLSNLMRKYTVTDRVELARVYYNQRQAPSGNTAKESNAFD